MISRFRGTLPLAFAAAALGAALPSVSAAQEAGTRTALLEPAPPTPGQRQVLVGSYSLTLLHGRAVAFRVFERDGALMWQPRHRGARRLLHQGGGVFHPEGMPDCVMAFRRAAGGEARVTLFAPASAAASRRGSLRACDGTAAG